MSKSAVETPSTRIVLGPIVIMDDDPRTIKFVKEVVSEFEGKTLIAASADEVVELATRHEIRYFILDIDMGESRSREGLKALRKLKHWWPEVFVAMLSNHGELRAAAGRLRCDAFRDKTADRAEDAHVVIVEMLLHAEAAARRALAATRASDPMGAEDWERDVNLFLSLAGQLDYAGKAVAIVGGEVVYKADTEEEVSKWCAETFPGEDRLIATVGSELLEVDLDRPLDVSTDFDEVPRL